MLVLLADAVGVLIVVVVVYDVMATALFLGHAGPITRRVMTVGWQVVIAAHRRRPDHDRMRRAGHLLLVLTVMLWMALAMAGWVLVFMWPTGSIVHAGTGDAAGVLDRIYFTGTSMTSLGPGDFVPDTDWSRMATVASTASGVFLATLSVTYLVQVVSAASRRRELAAEIHALGETPQDFVLSWWTGRDFGAIGDAMLRIASRLGGVAESHLVFPVLHLFHGRDVATALAPNVVIFDQAVSLLEHGVDDAVAPNAAVIVAAHRAVDRYVDTTAHFAPSVATPGDGDLPALGRLRAAGIPTVGDAEFRAGIGTSRLDQLGTLLHADGWHWDELPTSEADLDRRDAPSGVPPDHAGNPAG